MSSSREPVRPYNDGYGGNPQPPYTVPPQTGGYPANPYYGNQPLQGAPVNFKLSAEETRVLKECNRESFYQRCLPLMSAFGLGTYYAIKSGFINAGGPPFGQTGKIGLAVAAGFMLGKLSYIGKCESKILTLPDSSQLKQSLLKKKISGSGVADTLRDSLTMDPTFGQSISPFGGGDAYAYQQPNSAMDLDTSRPIDTFDDSFRLKQESHEDELALPPSTASPGSVTYEELRRRNREMYESPRQQFRPPIYDPPPYQGPTQPSQSYPRSTQQPEQVPFSELSEQSSPLMQDTPPATSSRPSSFRYQADGRKNQYGDIWDK